MTEKDVVVFETDMRLGILPARTPHEYDPDRPAGLRPRGFREEKGKDNESKRSIP